jgi:hypothetical protein
LPQHNDVMTHAAGAEVFLFRGRHNFTIGGDVRRHLIDIVSQQNPRGSFAFTGAATGHDFSDFLLGTPTTASIAYGNADKYFRGFSYDAYITDDWRIGPSFTVTAGGTLGVRGAVDRAAESPGESRRHTRLQRGATSAGLESDRVDHRRSVCELAHATGQRRYPAATRAGMASHSWLVTGGACRLRRLSQHQRLSVDHDATRAATTALELIQHRQQRSESADARERIRRTRNRPRQHLRGRSELRHRRVAQLAGVGCSAIYQHR